MSDAYAYTWRYWDTGCENVFTFMDDCPRFDMDGRISFGEWIEDSGGELILTVLDKEEQGDE